MLKQVNLEIFFSFIDKIKYVWSGETQKYCEERCQTEIQQKD